MKKIDVKVVQETTNDLPKYQTSLSAGCDIKAELSKINQTFFVDTIINKVEEGIIKSITIMPGGRCLIPTGIKVAIPDGYEIQIRPRSGLALKKGISLVNCVGTVDSDYRDEIGIIIINHGKGKFIIEQGERIGQLVLNEVKQINWKVVDTLDETDRKGGFGHTDEEGKGSKS